jgi:hypothetical protein
MTFTLEQADKVVKHYQHLIGLDFDNKPNQKYPIQYVLIAPDYGDGFQAFLTHFTDNENNQNSLVLSGFDRYKVIVIVAYYDRFSNLLLWENIDSFLRNNNLEKVYLNPDFLN